MSKEHLVVVKDHIADVLDDMAALGEYWAKNRERGRTPVGIRLGMIEVARELLALTDFQNSINTDLLKNLNEETYQV